MMVIELVFELKPLVKRGVFLTGYNVAMVTYFVVKRKIAYLPILTHFLIIRIVVSTDKKL